MDGRAGGSSPLTRGKRVLVGARNERPGIIPAHAGKTDVPLSREEMKRDHPRSRGENPMLIDLRTPSRGSSPLTRGKRSGRGPALVLTGIIPAHAGKTRTRREWLQQSEDHPRSRGENKLDKERAWPKVGSSPLTRGKQLLSGRRELLRGIIPAHAGKT